MWLMVFGVSLYYCGFVHPQNIKNTLLLCTISLLTGMLTWLSVGYSLSFYGSLSAFFNGMIVGLVGNTSSVGYALPYQSILIALIVGPLARV